MNKCLFIFPAAMGLFWTAMTAAADPAGTSALHLVFDLSDGSRIIGIPSIDRLKVATQYADLDVQLSQVRTVEFSAENHAAQVSLQNGDLLNGKIDVGEIAVKTIFGQVTVPLAKVRRMLVAAGGGKALPGGLVLHYTFDADEGGKVTDESGNGNDGIVHGATYVSEGKIGGAMRFNGDSQGIITKNSRGLQLQDFTIMAWIKRGDRTRVTQHGINLGAVVLAYGQGGYGLVFNSDGQLALTRVGVDNVPASIRIQDDAWHHLGVTKKGSKVVFYLDGDAYPAADYNVNFQFGTDVGTGARGDDIDNSFIGLIDEVAVFNRPLSEDEVKQVYESQN